MRIENKEAAYMLTLLSCALHEKQAPKPPEGLNFSNLFSLSKKHQIYNIICPLISKMDEVPDEEKEKWHNYNCSELVRMIAVNHDREEILKDLEANDINYMFLKGLIIRDYYPKSSMRQMSDNDILYDYSKREKLLPIMKKHGYKMVACCENSDDFTKEPYYNFEFHRELFFEGSDFHPKFEHLWQNALPSLNNKNEYIMNANDIYIYSVAHMYKHYISQGCGVRFLADLYLIDKKENLDFDLINSHFKEMGILDYAVKSRELAIRIFDNQEMTEDEIAFLNVFINSGIYGDGRVALLKKFNEIKKDDDTSGANIRRYFWNRLFPSKKKMTADYKELEKYPFLLWFYYIKRLFIKGFTKSDTAILEAKEIRKISKNKDRDA